MVPLTKLTPVFSPLRRYVNVSTNDVETARRKTISDRQDLRAAAERDQWAGDDDDDDDDDF